MKVLVIIDMQNDFISGSLANPLAEKIVEPICEHINTTDYDKIILTRDTHREDYLNTPEGKKLPVEHCINGTGGWCVDSRILKTLRGKPYTYIDKGVFGYANWGSSRLSFDREDVEITVCGTVTSICVVSNVLIMKSAFPNATIRVFSHLCADITPEQHEAALTVMRSCQVEVI